MVPHSQHAKLINFGHVAGQRLWTGDTKSLVSKEYISGQLALIAVKRRVPGFTGTPGWSLRIRSRAEAVELGDFANRSLSALFGGRFPG